MLNVAVDIYDEDFEVIEGEKIMSPSPSRTHMYIMTNLFIKFHQYFMQKNIFGRIFTDNMDIHLPDGNIVKPDLSIVCDIESLRRGSTVHGVPDFVCEILSRSTMYRDLTTKKFLYEKNGVKEYWIVNPWSKTVSTNILRGGKFELDNIYGVYSKVEWDELSAEEKSAVKFDIPVSIFDDLIINVDEIFYRIED